MVRQLPPPKVVGKETELRKPRSPQAEEEMPGCSLLLTSTLPSTRGSQRTGDLLPLAWKPSSSSTFSERVLKGTILLAVRKAKVVNDSPGHTTITV